MAVDLIAVRRRNWPRRQWRTSEHGNAFVNVRGFNIVVFGSRKGWGIKIEQRYGERCQFGKRRFETRAAAQAASFEALLWAERSWSGNGRYDLPGPPAPVAPPSGRHTGRFSGAAGGIGALQA